VPASEELKTLIRSTVSHTRSVCSSLVENDETEFHISLSRTFSVRRQQIEPLIDGLRLVLKRHSGFHASLSSHRVFNNDERTRSFLSLPVCLGFHETCGLISSVDTFLRHFGCSEFHQDPQPHLSIAWVVGNSLMTSRLDFTVGLTSDFHVSAVECKVGQKVFRLPLRGIYPGR